MKKLRDLRKESALTLEQVLQLADISSPTLSHIERGVTIPNTHTRRKLEDIFGVKINWLDVALNTDPIPSSRYQVEKQFRDLIRMINSLRNDDKRTYIKTCIKHLENLLK